MICQHCLRFGLKIVVVRIGATVGGTRLYGCPECGTVYAPELLEKEDNVSMGSKSVSKE